ncbi:3'-5' exonuclease [Gordonia sp. CPCC 206044]|uniref:3'-5' exonuclease n=1 Tax=Gordonia sp. CPCC 206044 TaxID=3140793 RepID=UPI003AF3A562
METKPPRAVVVVDLETTGLDPQVHHIWEIAVRRIEPNGEVSPTFSAFVEHDTSLIADLPESFQQDHSRRYDPDHALSAAALADHLRFLLRRDDGGHRPTLFGAVVSFDAGFLERLLDGPLWDHRTRCAEALTYGFLGYDPGGLANCLAALRLPPNGSAHTAAGDVDAAYRIWRHITRDRPVLN